MPTRLFQFGEFGARGSGARFKNLGYSSIVFYHFEVRARVLHSVARVSVDPERRQASDQLGAGRTAAWTNPLRQLSQRSKHHGNVRGFAPRKAAGCTCANYAASNKRG